MSGKVLIIKGADFSSVAVEQMKPYPCEASHFFPLTENLDDVIGSITLQGSYDSMSADNGVLFERVNGKGLYYANPIIKGIMFDYKFKNSGVLSSQSEVFVNITTVHNGKPIVAQVAEDNKPAPFKTYFKGNATSDTQLISINLIDGLWHRIFVGNIGENCYLIIDGTVIMTQDAFEKQDNDYFVLGNSKYLLTESDSQNPAEGYFKNVCLFDAELTLQRAQEICTLN